MNSTEYVKYAPLGFDLVVKELEKLCYLEMTKERFEDLLQIQASNLDYELDLTLAFKKVISQGYNFSLDIQKDLFKVLHKTEVKGAVLLTDELYEIKVGLEALNQIKTFALKEYKTEGNNLYYDFCLQIEVNQFILGVLDDTIDSNGNVKDDASPELKQIRNKIKKTQNYLTKRMQTVMLGAIKNGYAREDAQPTISNGRMVIPLKSESKRLLGGLSHGESGTGQTAYVEPKELFEHNNELQSLLEDEQSEIRRILLQVVDYIRGDNEELAHGFEKLVLYDFLQAKGKLADKINANKPSISSEGRCRIEEGRNPILVLRYGTDNTVPFDLELDQENRVLLLTGPNAGGKSILLKSVGVLQLMFQHGFLVPCSSDSEFSVFDQLFIDIGDGQSIDNELSTYSAHLSKMKHILDNCTANSLILVDEFGTGTEPDYGAALAESILFELNKKGIKGIFTTHFNSLKAFADKSKGVFNGGMLFNMQTLQPTFRFKPGSPGSSFALEIAKNLGLPERLIANASKNIGSTRLEYDKSLLELQDKSRQLLEQIDSLKRKEANLKELKNNYTELKDNLDKRKEFIEKQAKEKALQLLHETQLELKEFKQKFSQAKTEDRNKLKKELNTKTEKLEKKVSYKREVSKTPEVGDFVKHRLKGFEGEILKIGNNQATISNNGFEWKAKLDQLMVLNAAQKEESSINKRTKTSNISSELLSKRATFNHEIDVRGERTEAALKKVDAYINDSIMLSLDKVRIIHGKGEGILRQMIRNQLSGMAQVHALYDEHVDFGGSGITVVEFG